MDTQSTEGFQDSETILYYNIMVNTCHCTFVKTQRIYNTKMHHNVDYDNDLLV